MLHDFIRMLALFYDVRLNTKFDCNVILILTWWGLEVILTLLA
jgi:hypothetical protein